MLIKTDFLDITKFGIRIDEYENGWLVDDTDGSQCLEVLIQKSLVKENENPSWSAELEETHEESTENSWIDVYERDRIIETLSEIADKRQRMRLIEFGSSTGYMIQDIKTIFPNNVLIATDLYAEGLYKSYRRNSDILHIQCDNTDAPFMDGSMDIIVSLNVLEHIADDEKAIRECYRILKRGGYALFVVPRGDQLYDYYDAALYHKRRYGRGELRQKCEAAGFHVADNNHLASLIYPAFWLKKKWNRHQWKKGYTYEMAMQKTEQDIDKAKDSVIATFISKLEGKLYHRFHFRHGIREIILLRK